ncbi:MAG: hypothetical protein FJ399_16200, partial [Verrucomicrobia bacterium]|nr:hypothetical protein [Verrucomicrobiota bacterium]
MKHQSSAKKRPPSKPAAKAAGRHPAPPPNNRKAVDKKPDKQLPATEKPSKKSALRDSILKRKTASKPIAFSLDEVRAIAQSVSSKSASPFPPKSAAKPAQAKAAATAAPKHKPQHIKAASLTDILGFNPRRGKSAALANEKDVPEKFRRYYRLLLDLRSHLTEEIERHSEETLKRSSKDDAGDLSAYGQHMADAGTDTFDRDFALSMVASEQEA